MPALIKCVCALLTLIDARISKLNDDELSGTLLSIDTESVVIETGEGVKQVPVGEIMRVNVGQQGAVPVPPPAAISLQNGDTPDAANIMVNANAVSGTSSVLGELKIPRDQVRGVRLQPLKPEWKEEWETFLKRENNKDILVVPKRGGEGLDFLSGNVTSVKEEQIPFLLDGDEIPVPRQRVFGIVFARREQAAGSGGMSVTFKDGSRIGVSEISLAEGKASLSLPWKQTVSMTADKLSVIDFSAGRIHYLSDLDPITERYFGLDPDGRSWGPLFEKDRGTRTGISRQWKMSRDSFPNSGRPKLTLRGQTYSRGLCIFPSARIEYALDGQYSSLSAIVGVDDQVAFNQVKGRPPTAVEITVEGDGKQIWHRKVIAPDDPVDLNVDLSGINTLRLIVDFGDGSSTCDFLDLANARLIVKTSNN